MIEYIENERWIQIKGYRYCISDYGRVWSYKSEKLLKLQVRSRCQDKKYLSISLYKYGFKETKLVHRLVATYFVENNNSELKNEVNHKDGNPENNYYKNLEWVEHIDNIHHAYRFGLKCGKISKEKAKIIKKLYKTTNLSQRDLAKKFSVAHSTVQNITAGNRVFI